MTNKYLNRFDAHNRIVAYLHARLEDIAREQSGLTGNAAEALGRLLADPWGVRPLAPPETHRRAAFERIDQLEAVGVDVVALREAAVDLATLSANEEPEDVVQVLRTLVGTDDGSVPEDVRKAARLVLEDAREIRTYTLRVDVPLYAGETPTAQALINAAHEQLKKAEGWYEDGHAGAARALFGGPFQD